MAYLGLPCAVCGSQSTNHKDLQLIEGQSPGCRSMRLFTRKRTLNLSKPTADIDPTRTLNRLAKVEIIIIFLLPLLPDKEVISIGHTRFSETSDKLVPACCVGYG